MIDLIIQITLCFLALLFLVPLIIIFAMSLVVATPPKRKYGPPHEEDAASASEIYFPTIPASGIGLNR